MNEISDNSWWRNWKLWVAIAVVTGVLIVFLGLNASVPRLALFWLFGLGIGYVLQRSRFCFVSAISNFFLFRDTRLLEGILGGIFVATIGFAFIMYAIMPDPGPGFIRTGVLAAPFGWHLLLGGVMFGFGMLLAGGCIVGNLYRIGEGAVTAVVAFIGILAGMSLLQYSWPWWWQNYISKQSAFWLPASLGWTGAIATTLLVLIVLFVIVRAMRAKNVSVPLPMTTEAIAWPSRLARFGRSAFTAVWPLALGGVILGLINISMYWILDRPLSITGEVMHWTENLLNAVHLPPPPVVAVPGT